MRDADVRGQELVPSYLERLAQHRLLTAEEERELTTAAKAGCIESRDKLIHSNIRLVVNVARTQATNNLPLADLIQEGLIGLMKAIDKFEPERGFRFSTYATHWIRQAIGRAVDLRSRTIYVPANVTQAIRKVERVRASLEQKLGKDPPEELLAAQLGISVAKVRAIVNAKPELISLETRIGESSGTNLASVIHDEKAGDPEAIALNSELIEELQDLIGMLGERDRRIIASTLNSEEDCAKERQLIGQEYRLSRERMRQLEVAAIKKLRQIAQMKKFKEYLS